MSTFDQGRLGEEIAAGYLQLAGYRILGRNVRCGPLEVDLIVARGDVVALVEVRWRASPMHGPPEESVGARKRERLVRAALGLHARGELPPDARLRFDVVAVEREGSGLRVRHLAGLFRPTRNRRAGA
jgi:putative endonuclease